MKKAIIVSIFAICILGIGTGAIMTAIHKQKPAASESSSLEIPEESIQESSTEPEESPESESEPESEPEPEKEVLPEGYVYSQYTGLPVPEEVALRQPVAIMINNHIQASPQSGLSYADIVYEIVVEGSITRYMAVFQDYTDLDKIGPVRSTRRYFLDFAMDQEALLIHYGHDPAIEYTFDQLGCRHIEGISSVDSVMCWRSNDRSAPHNVYTNGERLCNAMDQLGFSKTLEKAVEDPMFAFYENKEDVPELAQQEGAIQAQHITIPYRTSSDFNVVAEFEYDAESGLYGRRQFGDIQIDAETGEQLTCKNVLIQIANVYGRGDDAGHMDMATIGEGEGYYICNGTAIPVTWRKESQEDTTKWYLSNGERLIMAPGKSWISIVSLYQEYTIE